MGMTEQGTGVEFKIWSSVLDILALNKPLISVRKCFTSVK